MTTSSRRNFTKAAMWSVPAVSVATAVPATAASCDPATNVVARTINLTESSSGSVFDTPSTVSVTYVNIGPDVLAAGSVITFTLSATFNSTAGVTPSASPVVLPSSATVSFAGQQSSDRAYSLTFTVTLGFDLGVDQSVAVSLNTTGFSPVSAETGADNGMDGYGGSSAGQAVVDKTQSSQSQIVLCETIQNVISVTAQD